MSDIINIKEHKKGVALGEKIQAIMNLDFPNFIESIEVVGNWDTQTIESFQALMDCHIQATSFDVAILFKGILEHDKVPIKSKALAHQLISEMGDIGNTIAYYKSGGFAIKQGKYNQSDEIEGQCLYKETLDYIRALIEEPQSISPYDICVLLYMVYEAETLEDETYARLRKVVEHDSDRSFKCILLDKTMYQNSLIKKYIPFIDKYKQTIV